jgi:hypothetical protein
MKVYIVLHYPFVYGQSYAAEAEFKDLTTTDNPEILGIFSTLQKARKFFQKEIIDLAEDTDVEYAKKQQEENYAIEEFELDNPSKKGGGTLVEEKGGVIFTTNNKQRVK